MVFYGIAGRPNFRLGNGKSTYATWLALTYQARFHQKVLANYHIKLTNFQFLDDPRQLLGVYNSFIVLDDAYRWLGYSNSNAKKLGRLMAGELRHHNNNMVIVSSRLKEYIPKSLRDHVQYWLFPLIDKNHRVTVDVLDADGNELKGIVPHVLNPEIVKGVWSFYNHREDIKVTEFF
jgi:hypothetical protein